MEMDSEGREREQSLCHHFGFAQRLARSLTQDSHHVEDVVQSAWGAVLESESVLFGDPKEEQVLPREGLQ